MAGTAGTCRLRVDVSPTEVEAGAPLAVAVTASGRAVGSLRGTTVPIRDDTGAVIAHVALADRPAGDGGHAVTGARVIPAPIRPGRHRWQAMGPDADPSPPCHFTVTPHRMRVLIWNTPPAVERGATFRLTLGVKCSAACRPEGWEVAVRDPDGDRCTTAPIGGTPWPGTAALYHANLVLRAPGVEGCHDWEALARTARGLIPHVSEVTRFRVRVVPSPECVVTVVAVDQARQTPVAGARVVIHPYRAVTDERGVARVPVPRGAHRLFVSGGRYRSYRRDAMVTADVTVRAELAVDAELTDADLWP